MGDQFVRGISGGEKRRVSVGVETLGGRTLQVPPSSPHYSSSSSPSFTILSHGGSCSNFRLLADSPTNGLDAASAFDVIKTARALADTGIFSMMVRLSAQPPLRFHRFAQN